jgi:hypothetical protein
MHKIEDNFNEIIQQNMNILIVIKSTTIPSVILPEMHQLVHTCNTQKK